MSLLRSLSPLQKCAALRWRFIPHTSSEGERKGETASCVPQATDSHSGIAPLCSAPFCAGPRRSRDFGSSVTAARSAQSLPSPAVSSSSPAPTSPPPLPHPSPFRRPGSPVRRLWDCASIRSLCKSRKDRYLSLHPFPVRLLSRLSACLLNFSGHPASRLAPSRRLSAKVRAIVLNVRLGMIAGGSLLARSEGCLGINICNREQRTAIAAAAGVLREIVAILRPYSDVALSQVCH